MLGYGHVCVDPPPDTMVADIPVRHNYSAHSSDIVQVTVHGIIDRMNYATSLAPTGAVPLVDILNWGPASLGHYKVSGRGPFEGAANLQFSAQDQPRNSLTYGLTDLDYFFHATGFASDVNHWDTSSVTSMDSTFKSTSMTGAEIAHWDTSSVTSLKEAFGYAAAFNHDLSAWDTRSVRSLSNAFRNSGLAKGVGAWDTSSVDNIDQAFYQAKSFNEDLGGWDTSRFTQLHQIFVQDDVYQGLGLQHWDVSSKSTQNMNT